jgi:penicillin-binding protein 1A
VSLVELTGAYLPFATGGVRPTIHAVREVADDRGRVLYRFTGSSRRVIEPSTAATMQRLLAAVVERGTGRAARLDDRQVIGKSGTTQNYRDAWFVAAAGELVVGVWVGNDDGRPMQGVTGGTLPAMIAREVLRAVPPTAPPAPAPARAASPASGRPDEREENALALLLDWVSRTFGGR